MGKHYHDDSRKTFNFTLFQLIIKFKFSGGPCGLQLALFDKTGHLLHFCFFKIQAIEK